MALSVLFSYYALYRPTRRR